MRVPTVIGTCSFDIPSRLSVCCVPIDCARRLLRNFTDAAVLVDYCDGFSLFLVMRVSNNGTSR